MENNKIIEEARERVIEVFGYDYDINCVVNDVLDRIDPNAEEFEDEICEAIDSSLIYYDEQWKVLHYYINPDEIGEKSWSDVLEMFVNDVYNLF